MAEELFYVKGDGAMNTNAVYQIYEQGREFYFYTKYAGGFSYPFEVAGYLRSLKHAIGQSKIWNQDICVAPLLTQMKGTYFFPGPLKKELLFSKITKKTADAEETVANTPFFIVLDVERYTVEFHFNKRFRELSGLPDITFPCFDPKNKYSGGRFLDEALARQEENGNMPFEEVNEMVFRELIEQAAVEQGKEVRKCC